MRIVLVVLGLIATAGPPLAQQPRLNCTIELLSQGRVTFGVLSHDRSLENARAIARSGLDYVFVDMEHGPLDIRAPRMFLLGMIDKQRIIEKGNLQMDVTPLVRIPPNGRDQATFIAKQVLDVGVMGVMFPYVSTAAEAELAVRSMRYRSSVVRPICCRPESAVPRPSMRRGSGASPIIKPARMCGRSIRRAS